MTDEQSTLMEDLVKVCNDHIAGDGTKADDVAQAMTVILGNMMAHSPQETWMGILSIVCNNMVIAAHIRLSHHETGY